MSSKKLLSLVSLVIVGIFILYVLLVPYIENRTALKSEEYIKSKEQQQTNLSTNIPSTVADIVATATKPFITKPAPVDLVKTPTPAPVQTPAPVPVALYTKATVATHSGESSCWSIINGNIYDLTSFVSNHPGGDRNILKICGKDGTAAFEGQHGGDSRPEATLKSFYLAPLTN